MKKLVVILFILVFMPYQFTKAVGFGIQVGDFNGIVAYSNGSTSYYSGLSNYVGGVYTGIKWQCVEYVQRYYVETYDLNIKPFFGNANSFYNQANASAAGLQIYPNGGNEGLQVGDILCSNGGAYGHIAIVREVAANYVKVIQQNWLNHSGDNSFTLTRNGNTISGFNSSYQINGWLRNPTITPSCTFQVSVSGNSPQQLSQGWKFWQMTNANYYQVSGNVFNLPVGWAYSIYLANENGISIAPIITNQTLTSFSFGFNAEFPNNDGKKYKFIFVPQGNPGSPWQVSPYFYMSQLPTLNMGAVPNLCTGNNYTITWSVSGGIPTLPSGGWEGNIQLQWYQYGSPKSTIAFTPVINNSFIITVPSSISGATIPGTNFKISGSNPSGTSMPEGYVSKFTNDFDINSQPAQPGAISGTQTPCSGVQTTYSISPVSGATSYTWTYSGGGTPVGTGTSCTLSATSSGTLKVKANNNCGSSPERTLALTVIAQPAQPGVISGTQTPCSGVQTTYSISSVSGATSYTWTYSGGGTPVGTGTSCTLSATSSGTLKVKANNNCGSSPERTLALTVIAQPAQPGVISGTQTPCSGVQTTYSISSVSGATSYTWSYSGGGTPVGTGTSCILSATSSGTLKVKANNNCGSSPERTLALTVIAQPAQPGVISGTQTPCSGVQTTYSISSVSGATSYTWTYSGGGTPVGTGTSCTLSATSSGTLKVKANNNCGSSPERTLALTVIAQPAQPGVISGTQTPCSGVQTTYSISSVSGATSYTWSYSGGGTPVGTGTSCTLSATSSGTLKVKANNNCGSSPERTLALTVIAQPAQPGAISGPTSVISGNSYNYSITSIPGVDSYSWSFSGNGIVLENNNNCTLTPFTSGNLTVTVENQCGSNTSEPLSISIATSLPEVVTIQPSTITSNSAIVGGNVTEEGTSSVNERGVYWGTNHDPELTGIKIQIGSGPGNFFSTLNGLNPGTTYFTKAYAINVTGTGYGEELSFSTLTEVLLPTLITQPANDISENSAVTGGNVINNGGADVTARGVVWNTSGEPSLEINEGLTQDGSGTGEFTSYITGLTPSTTYYVRAYATNSAGTAYGEELSFATLSDVNTPTIITHSIIAITNTTAISGGEVTDDGGAVVNARGVCWNTTGNPTTVNAHTTDGTGTGIFTSSLTGLMPNTTYYVCAYATNSEGTAYGSSVTFTTLELDQYFTPVWDSPYNPMTFYILEATIDELPLQAGDEVGLFDIDPVTSEKICVGAGVLTEALGGGAYLEMIASMDDGSNPAQANGFIPGHEIIYKLYNESAGEITTISASYPYPGYDEVYTSQGSAFVELNGVTSIEQCINLSTGWNIMSFRAIPENPNMLAVVQPLIDEDILFKVLNESGGSIFHMPFPPPYGQWSNTIGNLQQTEGYYVKVTGNGTLCLEGEPVETPLAIPLATGWNIISYPCEYPQNSLGVVQPLINAGVLSKVIDEAGGSIFYLPFPPPNGQWSNTIGDLESGEGYYIKVLGSATLTITCPSDADHSMEGRPAKVETDHFVPVYENNPFMPMHIALSTNEYLQAGDEIAVFDGEICVGNATCQGSNETYITIVCSMDDPGTEEMDGYTAGNSLKVLVWQNATGVEITPEVETLQGAPTFEALSTFIGGIMDLQVGQIELGNQSIGVKFSPNPFSEVLSLSVWLPTSGTLQLDIYNIMGQKIDFTFEKELCRGSHELSLDEIPLSKGTYVVRVIFAGEDRYLQFTDKLIRR